MDALLSVTSMAIAASLGAGVLLWMMGAGRAADVAIDAGLAILMATPVVRLLSAIAQEWRARDWRFAGLGVITVLLLCTALIISLVGS